MGWSDCRCKPNVSTVQQPDPPFNEELPWVSENGQTVLDGPTSAWHAAFLVAPELLESWRRSPNSGPDHSYPGSHPLISNQDFNAWFKSGDPEVSCANVGRRPKELAVWRSLCVLL